MPSVEAKPYAWPFAGTPLDPSKTCLVIIDMQVACQGRPAAPLPRPPPSTPHCTPCPDPLLPAGGLLRQGGLRGANGLRHLPHPPAHRAHPVRAPWAEWAGMPRGCLCMHTAGREVVLIGLVLLRLSLSLTPYTASGSSIPPCLLHLQAGAGGVPPARLPRHTHPGGPPARPQVGAARGPPPPRSCSLSGGRGCVERTFPGNLSLPPCFPALPAPPLSQRPASQQGVAQQAHRRGHRLPGAAGPCAGAG